MGGHTQSVPRRLRLELLEDRRLLSIGSPAVDPEAVWSSYLGGTGEEQGEQVAVDPFGNVLLVGESRSAGWVQGGYDTDYWPGGSDAFVAKVSPNGEHLWSTYLGGGGFDGGHAIATDLSGNVLVTGYTRSLSWLEGSFGGWQDAFVAKLSPDGEHLWSTYFGGPGRESGSGIATDEYGNVLVTGSTNSAGWVSGGFDTTIVGQDDQGDLHSDAFVAKLSPDGAHVWSTYFGGTDIDWGSDLAIDDNGNIVVSGRTYSTDFISGGYDTSFGGSFDAFVAKFSTDGEPLWSSYLGGGGEERAHGLALDRVGNILVAGDTWSAGWISGGYNDSRNGLRDGFVAKLSAQGEHLWSACLGGYDNDGANGVAVDWSGRIIVTGGTESPDWIRDGYDTTFNGWADAFVAKLSAEGAHIWSTYVGGTHIDHGDGIAVDAYGGIFVIGFTRSTDWVTGGYDTTLEDTSDVFVLKITDPARVVGRHVFYNNSSFDGHDSEADRRDDDAIAVDKVALLPGETATSANYTNYGRGINGIMVDVAGLPVDVALGEEDFQFRVGNDDEPDGWATAPEPASITVRRGGGVDGTDRVTVIWQDWAIVKQWLQVTVNANANTLLAADDVFYFGNAVGEAGNSALNAQVNAVDLLLARNNVRDFMNPAEIDLPYDYNRDQRVDVTDVLLARNNSTDLTHALKLLDLSVAGSHSDASPQSSALLPIPAEG